MRAIFICTLFYIVYLLWNGLSINENQGILPSDISVISLGTSLLYIAAVISYAELRLFFVIIPITAVQRI